MPEVDGDANNNVAVVPVPDSGAVSVPAPASTAQISAASSDAGQSRSDVSTAPPASPSPASTDDDDAPGADVETGPTPTPGADEPAARRAPLLDAGRGSETDEPPRSGAPAQPSCTRFLRRWCASRCGAAAWQGRRRRSERAINRFARNLNALSVGKLTWIAFAGCAIAATFYARELLWILQELQASGFPFPGKQKKN